MLFSALSTSTLGSTAIGTFNVVMRRISLIEQTGNAPKLLMSRWSFYRVFTDYRLALPYCKATTSLAEAPDVIPDREACIHSLWWIALTA